MATSLPSLLAATRVVVDSGDYLLVGLPRGEGARLAAALDWRGEGLVSLSVDRYEVSLVLAARAWERVAAGFPAARVAGPYRLITFDLELDFSVVGYLATLTQALAARGVSVYALSAYSRDHLLVRGADLDTAMAALNALIAGARGVGDDH